VTGGRGTFAVILGSGLGKAADGFPVEECIRFEEVAGLHAPDVEGHAGEFRLCRSSGKKCLFILGRRHHYEKADGEIFEIIRHAHSLGGAKLIVVSAAGSLERCAKPGEFVLIDRIMDFQFRRPIRMGAARLTESAHADSPAPDGDRGGSFLSLDQALMQGMEKAAAGAGVRLLRGTLACMTGPAYETAAEVRFLQDIGAEVATMSAAAEVAAANRLGMTAAVLCLVTNPATGMTSEPLSHREVLAVSGTACASLGRLLAGLIAED